MDDLRLALRRLAKAVVIITSVRGQARCAMAATAVSELSFDPPSMLVCVNRAASLYPFLEVGAPFAINILNHDQDAIAGRCSGAVKGEARFELGEWVDVPGRAPRLVGAQASIACTVAWSQDHGSHGIFIGNVDGVVVDGKPDPLIYLDGGYSRIRSPAE